MQGKYARDIGDFGKFILLRQLELIAGRQLRIGINWYRVTKLERGSKDGKHTAYLGIGRRDAALFAACDPLLLSELRKLVGEGHRSVRDLEQSGFLVQGSSYYSEPIPFGAASLSDRVTQRYAWFRRSVAALDEAQILFLDPGNGIQTDEVKKTQTRSIKYAFHDEIQQYSRPDRLVIIYSHRDHSPSHRYVKRFMGLREILGGDQYVRALHFGSISARDYLFLYRNHQAFLVDRFFKTLTAMPFAFLFSELLLP